MPLYGAGRRGGSSGPVVGRSEVKCRVESVSISDGDTEAAALKPLVRA